jgi:hypothetical protein
MGLPPDEREWLRDTFADAFSRALRLPEGAPAPSVAIVDFLMYVKFVAPTVHTKNECLQYFADKVRRILMGPSSTIRICVVMVDGKKIPVKKLVTDPKRYKSTNTYPSDARVWPRRGGDLIPTEWMRFAGNSKLMRRELYPELFNVFMNFKPNPGQTLVLSGFPGRSRYVNVGTGAMERGWEQHADTSDRVEQVQQWAPSELPITKAMERADPDLYHRVYMLQSLEGGRLVHSEWVAAKNDISEADVRMFYFDHWFQNEHIIFHLNDGDVFSIGLLYAHERLVHNRTQAGKFVFRNWHTVCMPYKKKEGKKEEEEKAEITGHHERREEYVDMNAFYCLVQAYEPFKRAGVDNHAATLVFLLIMAGSDFVPKVLHGMGSQHIIWDVFFSNAESLTHMVQLQQHLMPCGRSKRTIILDEDAFILFIYWCYLRKYEKTLCTELKTRSLSFAQLKRHTQTKQDARFHMPNRNRIRLWSRAILWNLLYWKNAPAGHMPDCFELWFGVPYFPYWRDPTTGKAKRCEAVSWRPKPVDAVYAQHMRGVNEVAIEQPVTKTHALSEHVQSVLEIYEQNVSK